MCWWVFCCLRGYAGLLAVRDEVGGFDVWELGYGVSDAMHDSSEDQNHWDLTCE